ncbi:Carbon catabolite repressor protein 4 [Ananas comosus]|uniref:Carbon catabolite repressor protein 4 n=1 Tax=Ananas comosus TaxID=4615 RepID=A0A199W0L0_ANACO|nr:Carbon catabolite repressor protein 4 [Ananas comosus]
MVRSASPPLRLLLHPLFQFPALEQFVQSQPSLVCRSHKRKMSAMAQPIPGKFVPLESSQHTEESSSDGFKFRLVSYNILAQVYVKSAYFPHSPSSCLKWKARSQAVLTELRNFSADILCIQELDEYESFYKKNMETLGYSSAYIQRTGEKRDGCGIFYKPSSAELILKEEIHYNDLVNSVDIAEKGNNSTAETCTVLAEKKSNGGHGDPNDPRVRLKRNCVGLLTAFKLSDSYPPIVVANTHIYWDPDWIDVKLAQAKYLLSRLSQFREHVSSKFSCIPPVIVAGDFNSTPGDEVYSYIVSSGEAPIKLYSLYAANGGEPPFTNCTPDFTGTLDYIFLSDGSRLKPLSLLDIPGPDSTDVIGGLPNHQHPSDHLPIGADFNVLRTA